MGTPLSGYVTAKSDLTSSSTGDRATCPAVGYWGWREECRVVLQHLVVLWYFRIKFLKSAVT